MIRVNLLADQTVAATAAPVAASLEGMTPADIQRQGLTRIFLIMLIPVALYIYENQSIPEKKAKIAQINSSLSTLREFNQKSDTAVREIKKFQEDEAKIKKQIETLDKLSKDRLREIQVLDLFQQVIPEKVWLRSVEISNAKLKVRGLAMSDTDVSSFIEALSRSIFLNDVQPGATAEFILDNQKLREFDINASLEKANE